jgi:glycosyltransferase involved in cell wall biosynthesis
MPLCAPADAPIVHIPHGTPEPEPGDAIKGRELLGLTEHSGDICLVFGFADPIKNVLETIEAFALAKMQHHDHFDCALAIAGNANPNYAEEVLWNISATGYEDDIVFVNDFIPDKDVPHLFAASDFGVLNTMSNNYSSSGAAHLYRAHGIRLAVKNKPIYLDAINNGAVPFTNAQECANAMVALANDEWFGKNLVSRKRQWKALARYHYTPLYGQTA